VTVADISLDRRSTASNTQLGFVVPSHQDGSTAAVNVIVAGDVTPVTAPPAGWVEQNAAYDAGADATFITWTNDGGFPASVTSLIVQWTGAAKAAGTMAVSSNSLGLSQVGAVTFNSVANSTGDAASVTIADDDELAILFGGTVDVPAGEERYPDLTAVSLAALTTLARTSSVAALIDAWALYTASGIAAGATGAVTYGMAGEGSAAAAPAVLPRVGFGTFSTGDADTAASSVTVAFPGAPAVGDVAVIGATGQPPDVEISVPGLDFTDQFDTAGVVATSIAVTVPAGHVGKYGIVEISHEGSPGTLGPPDGWTELGSTGGIVTAYGKQLTSDDIGVLTWTATNARLLQAQLLIANADLAGFDATMSFITNPSPYGPHGGGEQTLAATSLHLLTYTTEFETETLDSTDDAHTITNNAVPASHSQRTGFATDIPGSAGVDPDGLATWSSAIDVAVHSYILDPRPINPTNLATPAGTTSAAAWTELLTQVGIGDAPSAYAWLKVLDADDIADGSVVLNPTGAVGEFGGVIGIYRGADTGAPLDATAITSGAVYSATTGSAAIPTVTDNACEIVIVLGTDHGAPSHADSTVTDFTMAGMTEQAELVDPAGSVAALYDLDRATAGAGAARAGTAVNGLANEVQHTTIAFALKPLAVTGSRQVSQFITFQPAADAGPTISWPTPANTGACIGDPTTFSGSAADAEGVDTVDVTILRQADGQYWNGAAWQVGVVANSATLGTPGGTTTTWSYTATGAFTDPGTYSVSVAATDGGAPTATNTRTRQFCVAGPTATQLVRVASIEPNPSIQVEVIGRFGGVAPGSIVTRLPILSTTGFFTRELDERGEAEVAARYSPLDHKRCLEELSAVESWAHELRILWDGHEAFVGPVQHVRHLADGIVIKAEDLTAWWDVRVIGEHIHEQVDVATVFADYHRDAYLQEAWGMEVIAQPIGQLITRTIKAEDGMVANAAILELARTGFDFVAVGRTLLVGAEEVPAYPIVTLRDEHFTEPLQPVDDGIYRATDYVVSGGSGISGRSTLPETSDARRRYGLITGRSQERKILDEGSAARAAQTRLDFGQDPLFLEPPTDAVLRPGAPVDLVDLIPGARVDVQAAATARVVNNSFRLSQVRGNMDGTIQVSFQPLGTVGAVVG
jgi:hypothetical protein